MRNPRRAADSACSAAGGAAGHGHGHGPDSPAKSSTDEHLTIVIKLGSSSIVNEADFQPQLALLSSIVETVCALRRNGHRVVLVSSGAIAMGLKRMEMLKKPKILAEKQGLAAIGQGRLIALWDNLFGMLGQPIAQVLLTRSDISDRSRYLNSTRTLAALLSYGVIPIVNENDTVSVSEIKFGDNDTLSAITASMVGADYLFLLTDVDCLYTDNPRRFPDTAKPVRIVRDIESVREVVSTSTMGSNLGTGGMETKIIAAELATGAGVSTVITHGKRPSNILDIVSAAPGLSDEEYEQSTPLHTVFLPEDEPLPDKRWWVVHGLKPRGKIIIDEGAYRAIARSAITAAAGTASPSASIYVQGGNTTNPLAPAAATPPLSLHQASISTPPTPSTSNPADTASLSRATSSSNVPAAKSRSSSHHNSGNGGRLLPAGVIAVEGTFAAGQAVTVVVQRKRRRRRQTGTDGLDSATEGSTTPHRAARQYGDASTRSGSSSLANSLILEQIKQESSASSQEGPSPTLRTGKARDREYADTTDDDEVEVVERIEFGRGLANYNYQEIDRIKGHKSSEIERILGYIESEHCVESITSLKRLDL